jgi:mRNA interferase MazF
MEIKQYQVILVNLDPTIRSEIRKTRPCLVISPDEMNRHLKTIVIAPLTTRSKNYPTRIPVTLKSKSGWIALDQVRTIDRSRVIKAIATLKKEEIYLVKSVIQETFVD